MTIIESPCSVCGRHYCDDYSHKITEPISIEPPVKLNNMDTKEEVLNKNTDVGQTTAIWKPIRKAE